MQAIKPMKGRIGRIGLALAALVSVAVLAGPATADDWNRRHYGGSFSFGFGSPGYYNPPPPAYYYPPPTYYVPGPSFNLVVPFGSNR